MQKTSIAHPHITLETVTGAAVEAEVAVKTLLKQKKVLLKMLCRCWTQTSSFFQFIVWVVEAVLASEARGGSGTRGRWSIENFVWCSNWNDGSKQPEKQQSCSRNNSRKCLIFCILILYFLGVTVVYMHVYVYSTYIWKRRKEKAEAEVDALVVETAVKRLFLIWSLSRPSPCQCWRVLAANHTLQHYSISSTIHFDDESGTLFSKKNVQLRCNRVVPSYTPSCCKQLQFNYHLTRSHL